MKTQAVVFAAPEQIELREVTLAEPGPGDLVLRTAYTSISAGTERMLLAGKMPHPALQFPVVPGYETVGRVVWAGAEAPAELEGQWVYVGGARCFSDVNPAWGGQAHELVVPHERVVPLGTLPPRHGLLLALAATALHGLDRAGALAGKRLLVLGQGPVGQLAARLARAQGAWVAVADKVPSRLARAEADLVVDVSVTSWEQGSGFGVQGSAGASTTSNPEPRTPNPGSLDLIIEATGTMQALTDALALLAPGGTLLLLGYYDTLALPYMPLFLKEARLLTAREWVPGDLVRCREMLASGALDVAALLTHTRPLAELHAAYQVALGDPECLKMVLEW